MNIYFIFKLLALFFIGGGTIAFLSFIAERMNSKISGIILSFPSTIVISFIFLAYSNSIETVIDIIPSIFIPLGVGLIFPIIYINVANFLSRFIKLKVIEVIGSFFISTLFWLVFSIPIALINFSNLYLGVFVYLLIVIFTQIILNKNKYEKNLPINYTKKEKWLRFIFIGFMLVLIALLTKLINPFWGAIFSVFPAGVGTLLMIFHWNYSSKNMGSLIQKLPIGSLLIFIYSLGVIYFFPFFGAIIGSIFSYIVSLILYLIIKQTLNFTK